MSRVAVTGAAGFVGRHVVSLLREDGHEVRALIRPGSQVPPPAGVDAVQGDVRSLEAMRSLTAHAEVVIHLAASFSPDDDVAEITITGTQNMLAAASEADAAKVIVMSCLGAEAASHSPFFRAKWKAEQLVRGSPLAYTILRPSLVLGPGDGVSRPLADLIRLLPVIPLPGDGMQRQQPMDVEDLARCMLRSVSADSLANQEVSVGGPMFLTYRQLVDLIQGYLGVLKPKLCIPAPWLRSAAGILPAGPRNLLAGPRLDLFRETSAASPGIVQREFGFTPRSIVPRLGEYLTA